MLKNLLILNVLLTFAYEANTQVISADTIRILSTVEVVSSGLNRFSAGSRQIRVDSNAIWYSQNFSLNSVLLKYPQLTIKTNGPSGSSTLSFRGTQPTQSAVLWNGFNISSASMGMTDISLLPAALFDDIRLQYGGESTMYGSGVIGGGLHLSNREHFNNPPGILASSFIGSYGNMNTAARIVSGNSRIYSNSAIILVRNENRFRYSDLNGNTAQLQHSRFYQESVMQQIGYHISQAQSVNLSVWYNNAGRDLPASMVMHESRQHQDDRSLRTTMRWQGSSGKFYWNTGIALFDETMHFIDPNALLDVNYHLRRHAWEGSMRFFVKENMLFLAGGTAQYLIADVPYYAGKQYQSEAAFYGAFYLQSADNRLKANLNLRKDIASDYRIPFCPALGLSWNMGHEIEMKFSASKNFRIPTMNDRYWIPGGNPQLKPESSWNQEISVEAGILKKGNPVKLIFTAGIYNIFIINNIQWVPLNQGLWSPVNNQQVWSRGIETGIKISGKARKLHYKGEVNWVHSPSTCTKSTRQNDATIGKQLIYIPRNRSSAQLMLTVNNIDLVLQSSLEGKRYTVSDNSDYLPAYLLAGLSAGYGIQHKRMKYNVQTFFDNILDTKYQIIQYYPEAGFSMGIKLTVQFLKTPKP